MRFKVLKSSMDGISGGASEYAKIDDAMLEISSHMGWPSLRDLQTSILRWSYGCRPGDVYCTQAAVIVAGAVERTGRADDVCHHCGREGLYYDNLVLVEDGSVERVVSCPECGEWWRDVFTLTEQRACAGSGPRTSSPSGG